MTELREEYTLPALQELRKNGFVMLYKKKPVPGETADEGSVVFELYFPNQ